MTTAQPADQAAPDGPVSRRPNWFRRAVPIVLLGLLAAGGWQVYQWQSRQRQPPAAPPADPLGLIRLPNDDGQFGFSATARSLPNDGRFVGSDACRKCHPDKYAGFVETTHHRTSAAATAETVRAGIPGGRIEVATGNPELSFVIESRDTGIFQTAVVQADGKQFTHTERLDVVTGSGKLGQTYLYFKGPRLYQLPFSYVRQFDGWANSPGFDDGIARFARLVDAECLDCHATHFNDRIDPEDALSDRHIIFGISCERCHAPGRDHVVFHERNPAATVGQKIVNPSQLGQTQQIEICSQCHSGTKSHLQPVFSYRPGEPLEKYIKFPRRADERLGVHSANQAMRLARSRCFQKSDGMNCTTCHDPHAFERGNTALFSMRCRNCHQPADCGKSSELKPAFADRCVDCHMQRQEDEGTPIKTPQGTFHPTMWDHDIRVDSQWSDEKLKTELKELLR